MLTLNKESSNLTTKPYYSGFPTLVCGRISWRVRITDCLESVRGGNVAYLTTFSQEMVILIKAGKPLLYLSYLGSINLKSVRGVFSKDNDLVLLLSKTDTYF